MPTVNLTEKLVKAAVADPGKDRTVFWDEDLAGFGLVVMASGHKSYCVQYRANGVSRRYTIHGKVDLDDARKQARAVIGRVAHERDPVSERRAMRKVEKASTDGTFKRIAETYMRQAGKQLRTKGERQRILTKYIYPKVGSRPIDTIKRSEIVKLLDKVSTENGATQADHVLKTIGRIMSWHATRDDDFKSPIVRGMARISIRERARKRILTDDELRAFWAAAEAMETPYTYMLRFILLTGTRLREAAHINRRELDGADWTIPAARYKGTKKTERDFLIPLSQAAQDLLATVPTIGKAGWIFTNDGRKPIGGFSSGKRELDEEMEARLGAKLLQWQTHDLRRSARSLMARAGVQSRHAEIALGHILPGVEGTYDRHSYKDEKLAAFEALAGQVQRILDPQGNVVPMRSRG